MHRIRWRVYGSGCCGYSERRLSEVRIPAVQQGDKTSETAGRRAAVMLAEGGGQVQYVVLQRERGRQTDRQTNRQRERERERERERGRV